MIQSWLQMTEEWLASETSVGYEDTARSKSIWDHAGQSAVGVDQIRRWFSHVKKQAGLQEDVAVFTIPRPRSFELDEIIAVYNGEDLLFGYPMHKLAGEAGGWSREGVLGFLHFFAGAGGGSKEEAELETNVTKEAGSDDEYASPEDVLASVEPIEWQQFGAAAEADGQSAGIGISAEDSVAEAGEEVEAAAGVPEAGAVPVPEGKAGSQAALAVDAVDAESAATAEDGVHETTAIEADLVASDTAAYPAAEVAASAQQSVTAETDLEGTYIEGVAEVDVAEPLNWQDIDAELQEGLNSYGNASDAAATLGESEAAQAEIQHADAESDAGADDAALLRATEPTSTGWTGSAAVIQSLQTGLKHVEQAIETTMELHAAAPASSKKLLKLLFAAEDHVRDAEVYLARSAREGVSL